MLGRGPELRSGDVLLRMHQRGDAKAWRDVRAENRAWLEPWEGTTPEGAHPYRSYGSLLRGMQAEWSAGRMYSFAIVYQGAYVGQLTLGNVIRGSLRGAYIGYWIDRGVAGRGIMPTAVALALDFGLRDLGLHRIEISIRPENRASLRVVEKLHLPFEGIRYRYLHIAGAWRDHNIYVVDTETAPADGFVKRWERERAIGGH
jgi:ribosomal-protein-alanine N-acetyltransferase